MGFWWRFQVQKDTWVRLLALTVVATLPLATLFFAPEVQAFLWKMATELALTLASLIAGMLLKRLTLRLGIRLLEEEVEGLDGLAAALLVRRGRLKTFFGVWFWNTLLALGIVLTGFLTFGAAPLIWVFLNLGFLSPSYSGVMRYPHWWLEGLTTVVAATVGVYGGLNLNVVLNASGFILVKAMLLLTLLNATAASLETIETVVG